MSAIKFEAADARRLVDLLASDDTFRAHFSADPIEALMQAGLAPVGGFEAAQTRARCLLVGELASKEAIIAARQQIDSMLMQGISQITPALDAGLSTDRHMKSAA